MSTDNDDAHVSDDASVAKYTAEQAARLRELLGHEPSGAELAGHYLAGRP